MTEDHPGRPGHRLSNWFGHPARELTLLAVTGTNGKTTTTYLLKAMLEGCLHTKVGLIGTNQNLIGEESLPAHRTTPESYEVQELLREMADAGCTHVVMEASSRPGAPSPGRHPLPGGYLHQSDPGHLDFHGTMEPTGTPRGCCSASAPLRCSTWTTRRAGTMPKRCRFRPLLTRSAGTRRISRPRTSACSSAGRV